MKRLGTILAFGAALIVYWIFSHGGPIKGNNWVYMLVGGSLAILARLCIRKARANEQIQRDNQGAVIVRDLKQGIHRDYYLYLRPFSLDLATSEKNPEYSPYPFNPNYYTQEQSEFFETEFSEAMRGSIPILSLGRKGALVGASRVETSDEEWQPLFILLAARARGIFLFPGSSTGSLKELLWLRDNNLLSKTACLQPPSGTNEAVIEANWSQIRSNLLKEQFALPEFAANGSIFTLTQSGAVGQAWPLALHNPKELSDTINRALPENPTIFWPQEKAEPDASVVGKDGA
jgi:hypothetical protein